jgi:hypothetical protein
VHSLRIKAFAIRHLEQRQQDIATHCGGTRLAGDAKTITATGDFNIQTTLDLAKMFIELTAQVGKAAIVGGLEYDVSRNLDSIQDEFLRPLRKILPVSVAAGTPAWAVRVAQCLSGQ